MKLNTVALVNPSRPSHTESPPIGLGYLAAALRRGGILPTLHDLSLGHKSQLNRLLQRIREVPPLFVGITSMTAAFPDACAVIRAIRAEAPDKRIPVILGGPHPTALPRESLLESGADAVVQGEGEGLVVQIAEALAGGAELKDLTELDGVSVRVGEEVLVRPRSRPLESYPDFPPAWDLHPPQWYSGRPWQISSRGRRPGLVFTTRGCPYRCRFCSIPRIYRGGLVFRPPEQVASEVRFLAETFGVDEILIGDDNLTWSRDHVMEICRLLVKKGSLPWKTPNGIRVDHVDAEMVGWMARSGCYEVGFGIESMDRGIRESMGKRFELRAIEEAIRLFHGHGIKVWGFFVLGMPGETRDTIRTTIRDAAALPLDFAHFSVCTPYPGSQLYDLGDVTGAPYPPDWARYSHYEPFPISEIAPADLKRYLTRAYLRFYRGPRRSLTVARATLRRPASVFRTLRRLI